MELYQMRYFKAVADCGSMTKAAERLHVSQPALSKAIKALEEEMGTLLFDRVGRSIVLNEDGHVVHRAVTYAIDSVDAVPQALSSFARTRAKMVNLYNPVPMGDDAGIIASFHREHPDIRVRSAMTRTQAFDADQADLTFFSSPSVHDGPNYLLLGVEPFVLSLPNGHPLADRDEVALSELGGEPLVTVAPCRVRSMIDGLFEGEGLKPEIAVEVQLCLIVNDLVASGVGYGVVPAVTWFTSAHREKVSTVRIRGCDMKRYIYLKWPENAVLSESARLFIAFLREHYEHLCSPYGV